VGLLAEYAALIFSPVLASHERINTALSTELYRDLIRSIYWVMPKIAELIGAMRRLISGRPMELTTVVWTPTLFAAACFVVTVIYFSRKDY